MKAWYIICAPCPFWKQREKKFIGSNIFILRQCLSKIFLIYSCDIFCDTYLQHPKGVREAEFPKCSTVWCFYSDSLYLTKLYHWSGNRFLDLLLHLHPKMSNLSESSAYFLKLLVLFPPYSSIVTCEWNSLPFLC